MYNAFLYEVRCTAHCCKKFGLQCVHNHAQYKQTLLSPLLANILNTNVFFKGCIVRNIFWRNFFFLILHKSVYNVKIHVCKSTHSFLEFTYTWWTDISLPLDLQEKTHQSPKFVFCLFDILIYFFYILFIVILISNGEIMNRIVISILYVINI